MDPHENVSSLAEAHIRSQLQKYHANLQQRQKPHTPSLASLSIDLALQELQQCEDPDKALSQLADCLDPTHFQRILETPKASYRLLRAFHNLHDTPEQPGIGFGEAILRNERYLRGRSNTDGRYLVGLEELAGLLPPASLRQGDGVPTKSHGNGSDDKDDFDQSHPLMISTSTSFSYKFNRLTRGMLRHLDWSNLFLAGELVFNTLTLTDPSKGATNAFQAPHFDIYIYGLNAQEANRKVQDIYEAWAQNFISSVSRTVVKSAGTVTFFANSIYSHIRIKLKLFSSITQILLDSELDRYAIGFDGSVVQMLPRFARAVETAYSNPTSDECANLLNPCSEQEMRNLKRRRLVDAGGPNLSSMFPYDATFNRDFSNRDLSTNYFQEKSDDMFFRIKVAIYRRLGIRPGPNSDYRDYLTRRIRLHISGEDFQEVLERQLTIPLYLPRQLEDYLLNHLTREYPHLSPQICESIIPLHDSSRYEAFQGSLPSLLDTTTGYGNLRYWVITNTSMWAGQHYVLDEIAKILQALHILSNDSMFQEQRISVSGPACFRHWSERCSSESADESYAKPLLS